MKFFTKQWYEQMQNAHLLVIPESEEEWQDFIDSFAEEGENIDTYLENDLANMKDQLLQLLPEKFHPYILNGTINKHTLPKKVSEDLLNWLHEKQKEVENISDKARTYYLNIKDSLPEALIEITEAGLHDASIKAIHQEKDYFRLTLNGDGSFASGNVIVLEFSHIKEITSDLPLERNMWWLYEEADIVDDDYSLSVLFDQPLTEWTIIARHFHMTQFYQNDFGWQEDNVVDSGISPIADNPSLLNHFPKSYISLMHQQNGGKINHPYFLTNSNTIEIVRFLPLEELKIKDNLIIFASCVNGNIGLHEDNHSIVFMSDKNEIQILATDYDEWIENLYSTEFLDETAIYSIPIADEEIETALFSNDLTLVVRAWNTIYNNPENYVTLINKALPYFLHHEDEQFQQMGEIFGEQFHELGIISEDILKR
ncbi:DUF4085 family protein [Bacillus kwashiorkori]|uniref:DUF4085 family protein n=1 Tax=Bacillus kwashiorkori TaxID=1522318 RepID=UPI0007861331|nr:DUF4085 family protein [Bacillus kwashiorkori]